MPRYYFDEYDGDAVFQDEDGIQLDGIEAARAELRKSLPDLDRYVIPNDNDRRTIGIKVIDETGRVVVTATLSLRIETHS